MNVAVANKPSESTHHPPKYVRRPLVVVLLRVSRSPLHNEGVQRAELEQMQNNEDDGADRDENRQKSHEVASCE